MPCHIEARSIKCGAATSPCNLQAGPMVPGSQSPTTCMILRVLYRRYWVKVATWTLLSSIPPDYYLDRRSYPISSKTWIHISHLCAFSSLDDSGGERSGDIPVRASGYGIGRM